MLKINFVDGVAVVDTSKIVAVYKENHSERYYISFVNGESKMLEKEEAWRVVKFISNGGESLD